MSGVLVVHKGRLNRVIIELVGNISTSSFASEIRSEPNSDSPLLATWTVAFLTDGTDGKLLLSLDEVASAQITALSGYMDVKRTFAGSVYPEFDKPIEVRFQGTVTA
jgi:hypothetical protein